ncbi:MAG: HflK protein, partial [Desulfobacula sp.]|nr:HflK protein [Desulfobacula sp.]
VNQATQEKEQTIYKAREEYNKAVPLARGEAKRMIKDAEGYAIDRVNRAQGDAAKFTSVYKEYVKAKDVTRKRIYLESMLQIFPNLGAKYIIDSEQKNLLPFLNMGGADAGFNPQNRFLKKSE